MPEEALSLHQEGKLGEAAALYRKILAQNPNNADALHLLGVMEFQRENPSAAIALIDRAIEIEPNNAAFFSNLGLALRNLKRFDDALASFDRALALQPDYAEALNNRGLALQDLQRFDDALASYDRALAILPDYADALYNRANLLSDLKHFEEALASYDRVLALLPDFAEALNNRGLALQDLKRIDDAIASYDRALAIKPDYAYAHYNRSNALCDLKHFEEALAGYDRALALLPDYAAALNNRGIALQELKRFDDAVASYDRALALLPDFANALNNRDFALQELGRFDDALASCDRALAIKPDFAEALNNRGIALHELDRLDDALDSYDRALTIKPDFVGALNNRGIALKELKRFDDALASYERALAIKPDFAEAFDNRGLALQELRRFEDALASYDRALAIKPDYADALNNRGVALGDLERFDDALASYDQALAIRPDFAEALNNSGVALKKLKRLDDALASYDRALALLPDYAEAFHNRGMARLLVGDYRQGWADCEWRLKYPDVLIKPPNIRAREWQGEDIGGRSILIFAEQGLGDTIQFARYLPLLVQRGARVSFLASAKLVRLLRPLSTRIDFISALEDCNPFDFQCALMSLPLRVGTDLGSIPNHVPYLKAEEHLVDRWKQFIGERGFKIGIAWQGNPQGGIDRGRSFPLSEIAPLTRLPGVRLISLQKHHGLGQLSNLPPGATVESLDDEFDSGPDAFIDTAAVMSNLDLIITADTSTAHLAGALGCPTWVALKYVPDWRWLLDRNDSPWYPTMRLFRQEAPGDWKFVFSTIEQELRSLLSSRGASAQPEPDEGAKSPDRRSVLEEALSFHQDGKLGEAAELYRKILAKDPNNADALHLLGVMEFQSENPSAAIAWIERAIEIEPNHPAFFSNLGLALRNLERFDESLASYDRALAILPDYADALYNRGNVLSDLKHFEDVLASYDRALVIKPDFAGALNNRGIALQELKRFDDALESHDRALAILPDFAGALNNRGLALRELRRLDDALACCDRALAILPDFAEALNNRGIALQELNRLDDALDSYDRALAIRPDFAGALNNRGTALKELRRLDDAVASYDRALAIKPDYAEALDNRGTVRLLRGHYRDGWADNEWRWKTKDFSTPSKNINARQWQGEDLKGRSILIVAEQGLGDVIQFVRYLPLLVQRGARVTFGGHTKLVRLLGSLGAEIELISSLKIGTPFDFHCALLSLPLWFKTDALSIPNQVPYLRAEADLVAKWKARIGEHGFKVGIAWQGNPSGKIDRGRSIPVAEFVPLSRLSSVRLISLQKHHGLDQLAGLPPHVSIEALGEDFDSEPDAFIDSAAVMENLDLIITSDTAIAHLAGALARPTWVALKYVPDWRWLLDSDDSPWYPTMRLFRQKMLYDWSGVFQDIAIQLDDLLARNRR